MPEQVNINDIGHSWFGHLVFGSEVTKIQSLCDSPDYDSSNMMVELKINGVELRMEDFNQLLDRWSDLIEDQIREKYKLTEFDQAVFEKAEQLIKDKLGSIQEVLNDVEDSLWKLREPSED